MTRLRNPKRNSDTATPQGPKSLKVVFEREETKWTVIRASQQLKDHEDQELRNIQITPHRTYNERRNHAELPKT
ncbi:hypothetical protein Pmani_033198 [Petrolisthes manimaculis]|uniref:Uncharacterized protein n=1 Tax=Petrolisthes manimaculis TaxID=1843537 RepID=A0AAE1TSZ8_9EUCA|nr:hypothetical protein Pmani_033198 [Petrolisthes manimaculis]